MKKLIGLCLLALLIPYVVTLSWTGRVEARAMNEDRSGRTILLDRGGAPSPVDLEEYLIGVLAVQIPASCELETLKAQAIIARTYLYKQMGENTEFPESAMDLDYLGENQMQELWGSGQYLENYKKLRDAVKATRGQVIQYGGELIDPLFHRISSGLTRAGDELHPYLQPVDAREDVEAENYLSVTTFSREEFAAKLNTMEDPPNVLPEEVLENIQIVKKDGGGYVETVQIGGKTYSGEQIRAALNLNSCAFSFEDYEGQIRCAVAGLGHGYGFDQYGADRKAAEGASAESLLKFYYKNIVVISE